MKKRIAPLLGILLLTAIFFGVLSGAQSGRAYAYEGATYRYFSDYSVTIDIQENNVYNITETIVSDYNKVTEPGHGIIRSIPTSLNLELPDGTTKYYSLYPDNLTVEGAPYTTEYANGFIDVYIGDANSYASGVVTYTISYQYDVGDLGVEGRDFVYFNVIGTNWNADIAHASFSVTLPKAFDAENVWAFSGATGSTNSLETTIEGNTISGEADNLAPYEGITLQVDLPADYFTGERVPEDYNTADPGDYTPTVYAEDVFYYAVIAVSILTAAACVVCWFLFGRDKKPIPVVGFNPPNGLDPAQVGYIIDGRADNKDLSVLIIYWADQGLVRIEETKKSKFTITRLGSLPAEAPKHQRILWEGLFKNGDTVEIASLKENFYTTMDSATSALSLYFATPQTRLNTVPSSRLHTLFLLLVALPGFLAALYTFTLMDGLSAGFIGGGMLTVVLIILTFIFSGLVSRSKMGKVAGLILSMVMLALFYGLLYASQDVYGVESLLIVAFLCSAITLFFATFMYRHTPQGQKWLGETLGFRNFIVYAEKDRILELVNENPQYFYHILPYAHVLGVTDKWSKNFDNIGITPPRPEWYDGYYKGDLFTTAVFISSFNRSISSMSTTFASRPPSSGSFGGSGGFSGGGSSGGGFGGGGGGGW